MTKVPDRHAQSQAARQKPNTIIESAVAKCPRELEVLVATSKNNPVVNVEVTATFDDGSQMTAGSNKKGIALFENPPEGTPGKVTFNDEDDLVNKSFAADILSAAQSRDIDFMVQLLQSAVDYCAVKAAFQENYGKEPGKFIQECFADNYQIEVIEFLLLETQLIEDSTIEIVLGDSTS